MAEHKKMIGPYLFIYSSKQGSFLSLKVQANNGVWSELKNCWHKIDPVHLMNASYYVDQIEEGYKDTAAMVKITGFLSVLAITIASLGLLGMVVFSTDSRIKEISIRKIFGSSQGSLIYLLSRESLLLLSISVMLAMPVAFLLFDAIVLSRYAYHAPISIHELTIIAGIVLAITLPVIGVRVLKTVRSDLAQVLKTE